MAAVVLDRGSRQAGGKGEPQRLGYPGRIVGEAVLEVGRHR